MGASCSFGVGVGEMSLKGAITVLLFLGAVGIFFLYLSGQLLSLKKWAKNVCLTISIFIAVILTFGMVSSLFRGSFQTFTLGVVFSYCQRYSFIYRPSILHGQRLEKFLSDGCLDQRILFTAPLLL